MVFLIPKLLFLNSGTIIGYYLVIFHDHFSYTYSILQTLQQTEIPTDFSFD